MIASTETEVIAMNAGTPEVVLIGAGVADIPLSPVDRDVFDVGSHPLEGISMFLGGDAANEAVILSRLGHRAALISKVGRDGAGDFVVSELQRAGVDTGWVAREEGLDTAINIVLVRPDGERSFITNKNGSLRRLGLEDIRPALDTPAFEGAKVACLASLFVSPMLPPEDTAELFRLIRAKGLTLCADTTKPKHGETVRDIADALARLDYFFPNREEASMLTGCTEPSDIAKVLLDCGVRHVALKLGGRGCLIADAHGARVVPAVPGIVPVDTTGAGDTFAGGFIAGLLEGRSFEDCARLANAAASLCVETVGATSGRWARADAEARMG